MERIEYRTINKSTWERGEWDHEPDKIQFPDEVTGLPCLIVRGPVGALCGYVGVTSEHPLFGQSYDDVNVSVHGGLTFAGACQPDAEDHGICHRPSAGESDHVWWFGFDCAHGYDLCPSMGRICEGDTYKNISYVEGEIAGLVGFLVERQRPMGCAADSGPKSPP